MAYFEREYSNYPEQLITLHEYKDVDDKIAPVINEINELQAQGLYNQAARIVENNADILSQYIFGSEEINTIIQELRNAQLYAKQRQQFIWFEDENDEPPAIYGDVWIARKVGES